eukprot:gene5288-biopygen13077
MPRGGCSRPES